jgi:hypothetical protein
MEVMEHVRPDWRRDFVQKLLRTATKHLVVSLPWRWQGSSEKIPHNDIGEAFVIQNFYPYAPDWEVVVDGHWLARYDR